MCKLCETKPVYEFTNKRKLCEKCFIRWFQKKVLYTIRKFGMIKSGDVISYRKSKYFREIVLDDVLKMFSEKGSVKIVKVCSKNVNKIAVASTIDLESDEIIKAIVKGDIEDLENVNPVYKKIIKPLYLFLDKEVLLYAKLRKLKFEERNKAKDKIISFINDSEKKHPEVKRAIVKGFLKFA
ncbi:MAG: hypothetical protein P8X70_02305 [Nanoarchaeota archaeon]